MRHHPQPTQHSGDSSVRRRSLLRSGRSRSRTACGPPSDEVVWIWLTCPSIRELLLSLPVQVEPVALPEALGEITEAARRLDLTAYDAAYLQLAARRGLPLATIDERLRRAATVAGVALVG